MQAPDPPQLDIHTADRSRLEDRVRQDMTEHPGRYAILQRAKRREAQGVRNPEQRTRVRGGPKFGRNEPCPCGSGKKFKRCHQPMLGRGA